MGLNQSYKGFIEQVEASMRGDTTFIPNPLDRVGSVFNIMQSRYTLLSGSTGSGKTSFADFMYVLAPWTGFRENDMLDDIHWEVVYFSLERKKLFKHAKWISWMIYRDHGVLLSADQLLGWGKTPIDSAWYKIVRGYDKEISELLEHVSIYDGKVPSKRIIETISRRGKELGVLFRSDEYGVTRDNGAVYIEEFTNDKVRKTKTGLERYVELEYEGEKFTLTQNDSKYFMHNPKSFVFIVVDGINLFRKKEDIDDVSIALADARDIYGFSPIIVTQQNRSLGDVTRHKLRGADLEPQLEDVFASSQMAFDADLVLALFDPYRYKAYDAQGLYGDYNLLEGTMSPAGFSRFRSLHILKNTFGIDGKKFGMKFLGEVNDFTTLPLVSDTEELRKCYELIAKGM